MVTFCFVFTASYRISVVQCNIVVTKDLLFLRKLSFKVWERLSNHEVTTKVKHNNSNFKANCGITTHDIYREYFYLNKEAIDPFFRFLEPAIYQDGLSKLLCHSYP